MASETNISRAHLKLPGSRWASLFSRFTALVSIQRRERQLRVCEMLSLGEKRFVAVVEYGADRFLLAGTPQNISLLKHLDPNTDGALQESSAGSRLE